jgi:hypothetical protein
MMRRQNPSWPHRAWERDLEGRWISMSDASGTTSGRNDRECGAMGVSTAHGTDGATMGPPQDMEYAVEPDGVAIISPSACTQLKWHRAAEDERLVMQHEMRSLRIYP